MKPYLLFERYDDNLVKKASLQNELVQDLNLHVIFEAMAQKDTFLYDTAKSIILHSLTDITAIFYRQKVLKDCINNSAIIRQIYRVTSKALNDAAYYRVYTQPNYARIIPASARVQNSVGLLEILVVKLEELKSLTCLLENKFDSQGISTFYNQISSQLTDEFIKKVKEHISELNNISEGGSIVIGSGLGNGLKGSNHVLRAIVKSSSSSKPNPKKIFLKNYVDNQIPLTSASTANSAKEIEDAGLIHILRIVNHFTENISRFLESLRFEAGFYVGCLNLYDTLSEIGVATSFPMPVDFSNKTLVFQGLYDLSMSVADRKSLTGNSLNSPGKALFIITGANQGGKSTFLRSVGIAQLLMQCGLFVPAAFYSSNLCDCIFTHFTREEDVSMNSGKLDEELLRMNYIINNITSKSLVLLNEPFATTTERDGSMIARDIIHALYDLGIKTMFVTHLFEFSDSLFKENLEKAVFLRAERNENGSRTFVIKEGDPLRTSYGEDLFNNIVGHVDINT